MTSWGFDIDDKPLRELNEHVNGLKETVLHLGELILGEGASLFGLAESTADAGVEMQRTAEAVGTNTQKLQELTYAGKQWDVQSTAIQAGLRQLSRLAHEATNGSEEATRNLMEAGVKNFRDAHGNLLRTDQLLEQIALHFQTLPNSFDKAGLAAQLLGRQGAQLMPILNRLGTEGFEKVVEEGRELGFIMGPEAIAASEKFKESVNRIQAVLVGLRNTIGVALMPAVNDMVDKVIQWYMANRELIQSQITQFAEELGQTVNGALQFVLKMVNAVNELVTYMGGLGNVLRVVTAGFIAWTALSTISTLSQLVLTVVKLASAMKDLAFFTSISTGGLTAILGVTAALASIGIGAYAYQKMGGFGSMPAGSGGGSLAPVQQNITPTYNFHLPAGTSQHMAESVARYVQQSQAAMFRPSAAAVAGGTRH